MLDCVIKFQLSNTKLHIIQGAIDFLFIQLLITFGSPPSPFFFLIGNDKEIY